MVSRGLREVGGAQAQGCLGIFSLVLQECKSLVLLFRQYTMYSTVSIPGLDPLGRRLATKQGSVRGNACRATIARDAD